MGNKMVYKNKWVRLRRKIQCIIMPSGFAASLIIMYERGKMILLIVSDVILIFCTILFYNFVIKNNTNNVQSVATENSNGTTTIYIFHSISWKNIIMYLLFIITINLVIVSIIKIIEYKKIINVSLKYKIAIIIVFDIISSILLFPSLISTLIFNIIKYYQKLK